MHYHLEVVIPPVADVTASLVQVMTPFREGGKGEDGEPNTNAFWDWYVVGGRYAGVKVEQGVDPARKAEFVAKLARRRVTVSSLRAGKDNLDPASQAPMVDALWREYFPESRLEACPFFDHFNDQYNNSVGFPDVMRLGDLPASFKASHVIVAKPSWRDLGELTAGYMTQTETWNGVNFVKASWGGEVRLAVEAYENSQAWRGPEYAAKVLPTDDWLVVTVDYHS